MSCHLLPFSHIGEIKAVRDFLFPPLKDLPCSTSASNFEDEKSKLLKFRVGKVSSRLTDQFSWFSLGVGWRPK